ncbi:hypothetical protein Y032_0019g3942 [Ancylostoma ceylanicum]|uniref:Uncharacterized protein n=1 Tax=Ancylostoma ceylanicum TaxID=53326 RepID=A0A016V2I2_9BILA|nr:hypothetical protein Y032_0019g3942 [Ancylostoma ceylanicum]
MYGAGLSLCGARRLTAALCPTDVRSRRCCAAHRCSIVAVLCGLQMPDRGPVLLETTRYEIINGGGLRWRAVV